MMQRGYLRMVAPIDDANDGAPKPGIALCRHFENDGSARYCKRRGNPFVTEFVPQGCMR